MGSGLVFVFYQVYVRVWAAPVRQADGSLILWLGGAANRNQDVFEQRFRKIAQEIESEVKVATGSGVPAQVPSPAGP